MNYQLLSATNSRAVQEKTVNSLDIKAADRYWQEYHWKSLA